MLYAIYFHEISSLMYAKDMINIASCYGLLPDSTKP